MKAQNASRSTELPLSVLFFLIAIVALTAASAAATWWQAAHRSGFPYGYWLLPHSSWNFDIECFRGRFRMFRTPGFFQLSGPVQPYNYPAPMALFYAAIYHLANAATVYRAVLVVAWITAGGLVGRGLIRAGLSQGRACVLVGITLLLSYPMQLALFLDNTEGLVWVILSLGLWAYVERRDWVAACCFGFAGALKYIPVLFLALLISRREYKKAAVGLGLMLMLELASLSIIGPTVAGAYRALGKQLVLFRDYYIYGWHGMESGIDHSLYGVIRLATRALHKGLLLQRIATPYVLSGAVAVFLLYVFLIRKLPEVNQVLALTVLMVLLPPVSHDYTLLHLYAPLVLLIFYALRHPDHRRLWGLFLCLAVLLTSQNYLIMRTNTPHSTEANFRWAAQLKAAVLVALLAQALSFRIQETRAGEGDVLGENAAAGVRQRTAA